jgi:hypothetical protein
MTIARPVVSVVLETIEAEQNAERQDGYLDAARPATLRLHQQPAEGEIDIAETTIEEVPRNRRVATRYASQ